MRLGTRSRSTRRRSYVWPGLASAAIILAAFATGLTSRLTASRVERTFCMEVPRETNGTDPTNRLLFPPGSSPALQILAIRNAGPIPISIPRVTVNDRVEPVSREAVIETCRAADDDPQDLALCLQDFVTDSMASGDDCPAYNAMETLRYYGVGLCGSSSRILADLLRCAGISACVVDFPGHTAVEAELADGQRMMLDPFRGYFYADEDYVRLLPIEYVHFGPGRAGTPGIAPTWPSAPRGFMQGLFNSLQLSRAETSRSCSDVCPEMPILESQFRMLPNDLLAYHRAKRLPGNGAQVELNRSAPQPDDYSWDLPFPVFSMTLSSLSAYLLELETPRTQTIESNGGVVNISLSNNKRCTPPVRRVAFRVTQGGPIDVQITMRSARSSIPNLREGVNRIVLSLAESPDSGGRAEVALTYSASRVRWPW